LSHHALKTITSYPFLLGFVYILLIMMGHSNLPMIFIIFAWGVLAGIGGNLTQYWIVSAAPEAPEFANGIFLTSANLGTTIGASICGLIISGIGTQYVVYGGILFIILSIAVIIPRVYNAKFGVPDVAK
ncbi:MAG: transporter, partial [Paenibacillus sp.]|nr:transporter [Paenibacillus sp.]